MQGYGNFLLVLRRNSATFAKDKLDNLIAAGSIALSDNTIANVAKYSFINSTWSAIGSGQLPGPVTALAVNNRNISSIFAAGRSVSGLPGFHACLTTHQDFRRIVTFPILLERTSLEATR
jgi:hypothetical protein